MGVTIAVDWGFTTSNGKVCEPVALPTAAAGASDSDVDRASIEAQLARILANSLFKNSKRYPNLLRYAVERTLDGHAEELKERTLGVKVFGREPDYDTNLDPVVRTTAAEIRKRLAQYYQDPDHEFEPRIELPVGSYAARFHWPVTKPAPVPTAVTSAPPAPFLPVERMPGRGIALLCGGLGVMGLLIVALSFRPGTSRSALDQLWSPVLDSPNPLLLCVGQRPFIGSSASEPQSSPSAATPQTTLFQLYYLGSQNVAFPDVITLGRLSGFLQSRGKPLHIRGESSTTFEDLRAGPVILIGAFNNDWSMRLIGPRRFSFERTGDTFWVKDIRNPADQSHAVNYAMPYLQVTEDFALVTRVLDPVTERMVVLAGGLTGYGTMAAGEFLSDPSYLEILNRTAPDNWQRKNIEILISTKVINGKSGPPKIVTAHFW